MPPPVIWCLGMYGSASTWAFNVVRMLYERAGGAPPRVHFFSTTGNFSTFGPPASADLVKSHEISDDAAILELAKRAQKILISVRDPRDAVTSLIQARSHAFERAVDFVAQSAKLCHAFRADRRALLLRYETRFFDAPETIAELASPLALTVNENDIKTIFAANARASVERHIAAMPARKDILRDNISGDLLDPLTQWHSHHAGRSGEIGRWQQVLTQEQAAEVEARIPYFFK